MKFWKISHDKTMHDFERMLFYSHKTEILKAKIFKLYIICVYKYISNHMKPFFFYNSVVLI
jgi:hypothetical protein